MRFLALELAGLWVGSGLSVDHLEMLLAVGQGGRWAVQACSMDLEM